MESRNSSSGKSKPSVIEVAALLRSKGLLKHFLWDKYISKWGVREYKAWDILTDKPKPKPIKKKKEIYPSMPKKVIRLSDGKEFKSVRDCSTKEGIPISSLKYKILKGRGYKLKD